MDELTLIFKIIFYSFVFGIFVLILSFIFGIIKAKREDKKRIERIIECNPPTNKTYNYNISSNPAPQPQIISDYCSPENDDESYDDELPIRNNYWAVFPKSLKNGQKLYKEYEKIKINCILKPNEYEKITLGDPLKFVQEDDLRIAIYQRELKIGYVLSQKGVMMIKNFLDRKEIVTAFISFINPNEEKVMVKMALYEDRRKEKVDLGISYDDTLLEIQSKSKAIVEYYHLNKETFENELYLTQKVPMIKNDKSLYLIDKELSVYIVDQNKIDYDNLKLGVKVSILKEPKNSYDPKAVKVHSGGKKIGYLFGYYQELANSFIDNDDVVTGYVVDFNKSDDYIKIYIMILFYRSQ